MFAYMTPWAARQLLSRREIGCDFVSILKRNDNHAKLFDYRNVHKETITIGDDNVKALRKMEKLDLDAVVVVDRDNRLKGVEERDHVINRIILMIIGWT